MKRVPPDVLELDYLDVLQMERQQEEQDFAIDIMTDLLHWCDLNAVDFHRVYAMARDHFAAERAAGRNR